MKRVTIKDVAREAGVSISTVSNALNHVEVLHPKTRAHVLKVAERLNYFPNQNGQGLRTKETKAIGLFVSELTGNYYGILADTMHWACQKHGYELYIYITNQCATIFSNIIGRRVDGAVILYEGIAGDALKMLTDSGRPVVFIDREIEGQTVGSVVFDSLHEGEMATQYLISLGHKDLMFIQGLPDNYDSICRYQGFKRALENHGLSLRPENLLNGLFEQKEAYREMKRFISKGYRLPEAIFAANDQSAVGAIKALRDAGVRVPEDVSIVGCDDIDLCELLDPPLTTIHTSFQQQGEVAIDMLMGMLDGSKPGNTLQMNGKLIIRKSCQARKENGGSP